MKNPWKVSLNFRKSCALKWIKQGGNNNIWKHLNRVLLTVLLHCSHLLCHCIKFLFTRITKTKHTQTTEIERYNAYWTQYEWLLFYKVDVPFSCWFTICSQLNFCFESIVFSIMLHTYVNLILSILAYAWCMNNKVDIGKMIQNNFISHGIKMVSSDWSLGIEFGQNSWITSSNLKV